MHRTASVTIGDCGATEDIVVTSEQYRDITSDKRISQLGTDLGTLYAYLLSSDYLLLRLLALDVAVKCQGRLIEIRRLLFFYIIVNVLYILL